MRKTVIFRTQALLMSIIMVSMIFTSCGKTVDKSSSSSTDMTSGSKTIGAPPDSQLGFYVKDGVIILGDNPFTELVPIITTVDTDYVRIRLRKILKMPSKL